MCRGCVRQWVYRDKHDLVLAFKDAAFQECTIMIQWDRCHNIGIDESLQKSRGKAGVG